MLGIDESRRAAIRLRLRDNVQGEGCLASRLRRRFRPRVPWGSRHQQRRRRETEPVGITLTCRTVFEPGLTAPLAELFLHLLQCLQNHAAAFD